MRVLMTETGHVNVLPLETKNCDTKVVIDIATDLKLITGRGWRRKEIPHIKKP